MHTCRPTLHHILFKSPSSPIFNSVQTSTVTDMGEKKKEAASPEQKAAPAAENKDDGTITAVYKIDMHCEGCASKIRRVVKSYDGVVDVKADCPANNLTVSGKMDPTKVKEKIEQKIKKRVELISPLPKKDDGAAGGDNKADEKPEKKPEEKPKEVSTAILKIRLHCDGCIQKIRRIIMKINGVESVDVESGQDLVTVKGTMDLKQLVPYLKEKLRRNVELIPPKKDDGAAAKKESEKNVAGSGEKKDKETGAGSEKKQEEAVCGEEKKEKEAAGGGDKNEKDAGAGEKKEKEAGTGGGEKEGPDDKKQGNEKAASNGKEESGSEGVVAANKMEFYGYPQYSLPSYFHGGNLYSSSYIYSYANEAQPSNPTHEYVNPGYVNQGYVNQGYVVPPQLHAPQMFSDENPNACSIM